MTFDAKKYKDKLKKELGYEDMSDEDLKTYTMYLGSPTGQDQSISLNVLDYIETETRLAEESYRQLDDMMASINENDLIISPSNEKFISGPTSETKFNHNNVVYFDVSFTQKDEIKNYTVALSVNPDDPSSIQQFIEQSNQIRGHFTYLKERTRDQLLGTEQIISFYQYVNLVSGLTRPAGDINDIMGDISSRLNMIFEGAEDLEAIKKQFSL
jgi:hypothetical protein